MVNTKPQTNKVRYREIYKWFLEYKRERGCQMCGWNEHPEVLEAHHKIPVKRKNRHHYSSFLSKATSLKRIKEEVKNIIILCPNCHKWHHFKDRD